MLANKKNQELADKLVQQSTEAVIEGRSLWQDARRRFFRNKAAVASLIILFFIVLFITFAPMLMPFSF